MIQNVNQDAGAHAQPYIAPLDGVRAIAVLLVLIFHIDENSLSGGYIGVDVFFVVSGFIITRNISVSLNQGRFSFLSFYTKRIARLTPAVSVTIVGTLLAASFIYDTVRLGEFAQAGFYSIVSVSNVYFWLNSGYFDTVSQGNPFLHTWSLGVEEQFYLLWPIALLLLRSRLLTALAIIAIFGAGFSILLAQSNPSAAFYLTPARFFQFAIGGCIAVLLIKRPTLFDADKFGLIGMSGLAVILLLAVVVDGHISTYSLSALAPGLAAGLILCGMRGVTAQALSLPPMRYIGLRAYSVYLTHWPVVVLTKMAAPNWAPASQAIFIVALTWILAEILYRFVETPLRVASSDSEKSHRAKLLVSMLMMLVAAAVAATVVWKPTSPGTPTSHERVGIDRGTTYAASDLRLASLERARDGRVTLGCQIAAREDFSSFERSICMATSGRGPSVFVIADSFGAETIIMLQTLAPPSRIMSASMAGCIPVYPEPRGNRSVGCQELNEFRYAFAAESQDIGAIVIAANWQWWGNPQPAFEYLDQIGVPVIVYGPRPIFTEMVANIINSSGFEASGNNLAAYLRVDLTARHQNVAELARDYANITYIDLWSLLCPDECRAVTPSGDALYIDNVHLTPAGALWLANETRPQLQAVSAVIQDER